jgi:hypothetical protein
MHRRRLPRSGSLHMPGWYHYLHTPYLCPRSCSFGWKTCRVSYSISHVFRRRSLLLLTVLLFRLFKFSTSDVTPFAGTISQILTGLCINAPYDFDSVYFTDFDSSAFSYLGGCSLVYSLDTVEVASVSLPAIADAKTQSTISLTGSATPTATSATLIASVSCLSAPAGAYTFGIDNVVLTSDPYGIKRK